MIRSTKLLQITSRHWKILTDGWNKDNDSMNIQAFSSHKLFRHFRFWKEKDELSCSTVNTAFLEVLIIKSWIWLKNVMQRMIFKNFANKSLLKLPPIIIELNRGRQGFPIDRRIKKPFEKKLTLVALTYFYGAWSLITTNKGWKNSSRNVLSHEIYFVKVKLVMAQNFLNSFS